MDCTSFPDVPALSGLQAPAQAARAPVAYQGDFTVPVDPKVLGEFCKQHHSVTGDLIFDRTTFARPFGHVVHPSDRWPISDREPPTSSLDGLTLDAMAGVPLKACAWSATRPWSMSRAHREVDLRAARIVIEQNDRLQAVKGCPQSSETPTFGSRKHRPAGATSFRMGIDEPRAWCGGDPRQPAPYRGGRPGPCRGGGVDLAPRQPRLRTWTGLPLLSEVETWEVVGQPMLQVWNATPGCRSSSTRSRTATDWSGCRACPTSLSSVSSGSSTMTRSPVSRASLHRRSGTPQSIGWRSRAIRACLRQRRTACRPDASAIQCRCRHRRRQRTAVQPPQSGRRLGAGRAPAGQSVNELDGRTIAAVDLGSNSFHLVVAQLRNDARQPVIDG